MVVRRTEREEKRLRYGARIMRLGDTKENAL